MSTAGAPRQELAKKLADKCRRHHLIVWDDPAQQYESAVDAVVPDGWDVARYAGSWWDLRRRVEGTFSGAEPPKLVVYVPATPPSADPLEEIRRGGSSFKRLLPTVLKDALGGELSTTRIDELGARCATLAAVEAALEGGSEFDPVLVSELGARDAEQALARLLLDKVEPSTAARGALAELALAHLGATIDPEVELTAAAESIARHLLLAGIASAVGDDPVAAIVPTWAPLTRVQARHAGDLVDRASRPDSLERWGELVDRAADALGLPGLTWNGALADCDIARFVDDLAFAEAARLLGSDRAAALDLVTARLERSRWLKWRDQWSTRLLSDFGAVRSIGRLHQRIDDHPVPNARSLDELYRWYADGAWRVDRAHRLMEAARFGLVRPGLDAAFTTARQAYLAWVERVLTAANAAATSGADTNIPAQAEVFSRFIAGQEKTALVIVDAMRLELGHRLAELLQTPTSTPSVVAASTVPPTITPVGMANLLPDAATAGLGIDLDGDTPSVRVGGRPIRTVDDRTAEYRRAAGRVEDHRLSDWLSLGDDVLVERVAAADLLIVRSQEIDAAGEQGLATVRWSQIDATTEALAILVGRLTAAGVKRLVVTADHGFLSLGRPLDSARVRPVPTGPGTVVHGRAWIGRAATVPGGCTALTLADFGVDSSEQLIVPDGMTVFGSAGAGFFHGGISPQEALIPVVVVDAVATNPAAADLLSVDIEVPGGRVSAEAFSTKITLGGSLFATDVAVRITAANDAGQQVARLVPGESVDPHTGTVRLDPGAEAILTFLVTENLDKGEAVQIAVLDAATGRQLTTAEATVARNLRPEEDW